MYVKYTVVNICNFSDTLAGVKNHGFFTSKGSVCTYKEGVFV